MGEKENNFHNAIFFLASPILSLPMTLYGIFKKSQFSLFLFSLTIGFLSYLYIPYMSDDKATHYFRYIDFSNMSWNQVAIYLTDRPDFLFSIYLAIMSKIGFSYQIMVALISIASVSITFFIFDKLTRDQNKYYFLSFILVFLTINILALFSGIRYYFACTLVFWAFYYLFFAEKKGKGFVLLFLASCTHFSTLLFIPVALFIIILKNKPNWARVLFLISFLFLLIPRSEIFIQISNFGFLDNAIDAKLNTYLGESDFVTTGMENSSSAVIIYWGSDIWLYIAYIYLLFTWKQISPLRTILYCQIFFINFFYQAPTVFQRYILVIQFFFALLIIMELIKSDKKKIYYLFLALFSIRFIFQLIIIRYIIFESYCNSDSLLLVTGLLREITDINFLRN
ncbi:MAG: EpsG family protein [Bacteroidales bacterium]